MTADYDTLKIDLESFKSYLETSNRSLAETSWNHLGNMITDMQAILDYGNYGPYPKDIFDMKIIYENIIEEIQNGTVFDNDSLDDWKIYYLNKNNGKSMSGKRLTSKKVSLFLKTGLKPKIEKYIESVRNPPDIRVL